MIVPRHGYLLLSILCATLVAAAFSAGLPGDFLLDDIPNIVENNGIRLRSLRVEEVVDAASSVQPGGAVRTLPTLTFALDYLRGGGLDPSTFRATNIGIHALTTLVLGYLLRTLLIAGGVQESRARWWAPALALAWALHPLQVSSVLYIVQRMQTLATLFIVLSLWAYVSARRGQVEGRSGRTGWLLAALAWVGALGCKEDAILAPAYAFAIELTVFRFRAAEPALARAIRKGYLLAATIGACAYLIVVLPSAWSWDNYPTRDFSSLERLLTQGRVLCMYLWQILLPLPRNMPFFYDWLQPSRGILSPWTTLFSLLVLAGIAALAWWARRQRPLLALGIMVFLLGHFVTSNVIPLELAFEHRNHFPLLGIVLVVGDLLMLVQTRMRVRPFPMAAAGLLLLAILSGATLTRASDWQSGLQLAQTSTRIAPKSVRAWHYLCTEWYDAGGGPRPSNVHLDRAIAACNVAADLAPASVASLTNVLLFKSLQGTAEPSDWNAYLTRLRTTPVSGEIVATMWNLISMVRRGVALDENGVLAALDAVNERVLLPADETAAIGFFIFTESDQPQRAYPYFVRAVKTTEDAAFADQLVAYLRTQGQADWADELQAIIGAHQ